MSVTFKPPAPAPEKPAPVRAEAPTRSEAAKRDDGNRFKEDLREARRGDETRRSERDDRPDAADASPGAADESGFKLRLSIFSVAEEGLDAPAEAMPAETEMSPAAVPASAQPAGAATVAAAAKSASTAEPQTVPTDGDLLRSAAAKPPTLAETAPAQSAKPPAEAGKFVLPQETATDGSQLDDAVGDLDLFADQSLKNASAETQAKTPATAPPARTMPTVVPLDHVAVHIATSAAKGIDKIQIHLTPASLGRIDVEMEVGHDGRIDAVVRVDKPETMELLQRDARQLVRALQDAGLQADSGSLSFELRDQGGQQQDRPTRAGSQALNDNGAAGGNGNAAESASQPPTRRVMLGGVDIIA